jgi:N-methylhydantoinase A
VTAVGPSTEVELAAAEDGGRTQTSTRKITLGGRAVEANVFSGGMSAGTELEGPAIVELPESTLLIPPGWSGNVEPTGTIVIRR